MKKYDSQTEIPLEIIQLWEAAWASQPTKETPFIVPMEGKKQTVNFRQHLYIARKQLIRDNYPGAVNFGKLQINQFDDRIEIVLPSWFKAIQTKLNELGVEQQVVREINTPAPESELEITEEGDIDSGPPPMGSENARAVLSLFNKPGEAK
jgi:hypothetical protein